MENESIYTHMYMFLLACDVPTEVFVWHLFWLIIFNVFLIVDERVGEPVKKKQTVIKLKIYMDRHKINNVLVG